MSQQQSANTQQTMPFMCYLPTGLSQEQIDALHQHIMSIQPICQVESGAAEKEPEDIEWSSDVEPNLQEIEVESAEFSPEIGTGPSNTDDVFAEQTPRQSAELMPSISVAVSSEADLANQSQQLASPMDDCPAESATAKEPVQGIIRSQARISLKPKIYVAVSRGLKPSPPVEEDQRAKIDQLLAAGRRQAGGSSEEQPTTAQEPTTSTQQPETVISQPAAGISGLYGIAEPPVFTSTIPSLAEIQRPKGHLLLEDSASWIYFCAENAEYILKNKNATLAGLIKKMPAAFANVSVASQFNQPNGDLNAIKIKRDEADHGMAHLILLTEDGLERLKTILGQPRPMEALRRLNTGARKSIRFTGLRLRFVETLKTFSKPKANEFFTILANLVAVQLPNMLTFYFNSNVKAQERRVGTLPSRPIIAEARILEEYELSPIRDNVDSLRLAKLSWNFGSLSLKEPLSFPRYMAEIKHTNYDLPMELWSWVDQRTNALTKVERLEIRAFTENFPSPYHLNSSMK